MLKIWEKIKTFLWNFNKEFFHSFFSTCEFLLSLSSSISSLLHAVKTPPLIHKFNFLCTFCDITRCGFQHLFDSVTHYVILPSVATITTIIVRLSCEIKPKRFHHPPAGSWTPRMDHVPSPHFIIKKKKKSNVSNVLPSKYQQILLFISSFQEELHIVHWAYCIPLQTLSSV